jgi:hypothetical protein
MNQFDELFGNKLNDEQSFGGQKRSWTQLNHDLNAFEVGSSVAAKSLALWKAVSVVAILSSVALLWERQHLVRENDRLKAIPAQQQNTMPARQDMASIPENTLKNSNNNVPVQTAQSTQEQHPTENLSDVPPKFNRSSSSQSVFAKTNPSTVSTPKAEQGQIPGAALPYPAFAGDVKLNAVAAEGAKSSVAADTLNKSLSVNNLNVKAALAPTVDTPMIATNTDSAAVDTLLNKIAVNPDSTQQSPIVNAAPVIEQVHSRNKRWLAGVRLSIGQPLPKEKGLSMVKSQGLGLAFRVWNGFSVTAFADFMQFDVNSDSMPQHYCAVKLPPPSPGHHYFDLENVSSNQVMQQYNLGLRYTVKLFGPWRLSANAAHTWVHQPSRFASLRFEEMQPHGGGPGWHPDDEYLTIQSTKTWTSNIWRMGFGVHFETMRWSFGINGDYAKKIGDTQPSFETAYASAEIMYKF